MSRANGHKARASDVPLVVDPAYSDDDHTEEGFRDAPELPRGVDEEVRTPVDAQAIAAHSCSLAGRRS